MKACTSFCVLNLLYFFCVQCRSVDVYVWDTSVEPDTTVVDKLGESYYTSFGEAWSDTTSTYTNGESIVINILSNIDMSSSWSTYGPYSLNTSSGYSQSITIDCRKDLLIPYGITETECYLYFFSWYSSYSWITIDEASDLQQLTFKNLYFVLDEYSSWASNAVFVSVSIDSLSSSPDDYSLTIDSCIFYDNSITDYTGIWFRITGKG